MHELRTGALVLAFVALAAGCTTDASPSSTTNANPTTSPALAVSSTLAPTQCHPTVTETGGSFAEAQATTADGFEVWVLIFNNWQLPHGDPVRIPAAQEIKLVWRVTGDGAMSLRAVGPAGVTVEPGWGPDLHSSSNWNRPGDEWGTGWTFPEAGCWTFEITRGTKAATLAAEMFD